MGSLFLLLGCNLSYIVDLFAALRELASASARTLLKLALSVRALLKPYGDFHSGQTTGHSREHARDLSTSGQFPSSSHKIPRSTSATRAISGLSSVILPLQTFFSRVLLVRQQPFSSENLPPERPTTTIAIKTQASCFATKA